MVTFQRMALGCFILLSAISTATAEPLSEFIRICQASLAKSEAFVSECTQNARPFRRTFFPIGGNEGVPEEHAAWFDASTGGAHFGLGCVLGPKKEVRFLGIYFFLKQENFRRANSLSMTFIDFQGNVGVQSVEGTPIVLLAVHRLTAPGQAKNFRDRNCDVGHFDEAANKTVLRYGHGYKLHRAAEGNPSRIVTCHDREQRFEPSHCLAKDFRAFLDNTASPIIYDEHSIKITERGRFFLEAGLYQHLCESNVRSPLEFVNFIKETCGYGSKQ
jgi:hypothetical protein